MKRKQKEKSLLDLMIELKRLDEEITVKVSELKDFMVKENPELRYIS